MNKKKFRIAILLQVSRVYDRDILTGITNFNKLHDKFIFFLSPPYYTDIDNGAKLIQRIIDWKPDAILTNEVPGLDKLEALDIPIIVLPFNQPLPEHINLRGDGNELGGLVADYFTSRGYNNFAFFGLKDFYWSVERQMGYCFSIEKLGYTVNTFLYDTQALKWEELPVKLVNWLASIKTPCAIFSATDELNVPLIEAAKEFGVKVPDDISIMGVDNDIMICEMISPSLSSVGQGAIQAGFDTALALHRWLAYNEPPEGDILVGIGAIVTRNSTNALAIADEQVRKALHYIANTAPYKDISVEDVVQNTTLSRRVLEKKFKGITKTTILEEIKKKRIERIKFLLVNSDLTVKEIAWELDFRNVDNITRYFKQYTHSGLLEYRNNFRRF
ncbi:hypothetical protein DBR40_22025 [Pedobacter sp. KBW01]|uniref:XylR family transcriptional regulator n=1 Tax=Pedobacter sp. KBW01 TaxID=2153364 RepID=UPI000F5939C9|nr:DNA-binding transcriptional regulator [Pedobacter sp. KBW01]RQO66561.1 hypothetical protein DBR40_22025 [Pedobacter sp. KBW01]